MKMQKLPKIAPIYATAIFENSPNAQIMNEELESLKKINKHEGHLVNNIDQVYFEPLSTIELRNRLFKHTCQVIINVKNGNLWETPRSYLWKHIGQDNWASGNGTEISIIRIHQK